jgi:hypothetical protein
MKVEIFSSLYRVTPTQWELAALPGVSLACSYQGELDLHRAARYTAVGVRSGGVVMSQQAEYLYNAARAVDPLGDAEREDAKSARHNRAKVGSSRPSELLYTYGPGAIMDLPQFTIMPTGLDDWDRIWNRREGDPPQIRAPRLRELVRMYLRSPNVQLRPHPWQPKRMSFSTEGNDLGVPTRVFPQWLRCTGCDMLGLLSQFDYTNTHPYRTDLACSSTRSALDGGALRTSRRAAPRCRPAICSSAPSATWTSFPMTCGSTTASVALGPSFPLSR